MLLQRTLTSVVLISLVAAVVFWLPLWVFLGVLCVLIGKSLHEFYTLIQSRGLRLFRVTGLMLGIAIPIFVFLEKRPHAGFGNGSEYGLFFLAALILFAGQFTRKEVTDAVKSVAVTMFGLIYISWFLSFIMKLRLLPSGAFWVGFLLLVVKSGDIGAYLFGSYLGKTKLIPRISPGKSVEGAWAGLACSVAMSCLGTLFLPINGWHLPLLGLYLGILGQVGDLAESLMKRDCNVKDSGRIFPGMGGALDIVDSLLLAAPALYYYLQWITFGV